MGLDCSSLSSTCAFLAPSAAYLEKFFNLLPKVLFEIMKKDSKTVVVKQ